jgi:6-phosphogluconolactonase
MNKTTKPYIKIYQTPAEVSEAAAQLFVTLASTAAAENRPFRVALSGGTTPAQLYELLATRRFSTIIPWDLVEIFWGDERFVAHTSDESNYRLAKMAMLDKIPLPSANIHPMPTLPLTPSAAAAAYASTIASAFNLAPGQIPRFDLVLLGLGPDGHTASLFPQTTALTVSDSLVTENFVPKLAAWRLTLTLPVINNAAQVVFLAVGAAKAPVLRTILTPTAAGRSTYPAQLVQPTSGQLYFIIDETAAAQA